jgi:hypothetical protein
LADEPMWMLLDATVPKAIRKKMITPTQKTGWRAW